MNRADLIVKGSIFDSLSGKPYKGYVATSGNKIIAVCAGDDVSGIACPATKTYDMGDRLVMPGFHDSHTHLFLAGIYKSHINLAGFRSEEDVCEALYEAYKGGPENKWVFGFSWYHVFWDNRTFPTKHSLDKYFPGAPVLLFNAGLHGAWVNSKALEIAGITRDTPDPFGGSFSRDEDGEPSGFLYESAIAPVIKHAFQFTYEEEMRYLKAFISSAASLGITSVNDMQPYFGMNMGSLEAYKDIESSGEMSVRVNVAKDLLGDLDAVIEDGRKYDSDKLKVSLLKQFMDGVPTAHTALVVDDYADAPGNRGISLAPLDEIKAAVLEAHRRGMSVRLHSCGDMSARLALDYYEEAIKIHGRNECRHGIEHVEFLTDQDVPRFGRLGVIASMQPEHIAMTRTFDKNPYPEVLGCERANKTWPLKTMLDQNGVIAIGSDCPVVNNSPFLEIFRAVTRLHDDGKPEGGWNPAEKLTLAEVLTGYTYGGAYAVRREKELGTLEAGKFADIVVIDRNLFEIDPWDILRSAVQMTIFDGEVIYRK